MGRGRGRRGAAWRRPGVPAKLTAVHPAPSQPARPSSPARARSPVAAARKSAPTIGHHRATQCKFPGICKSASAAGTRYWPGLRGLRRMGLGLSLWLSAPRRPALPLPRRGLKRSELLLLKHRPSINSFLYFLYRLGYLGHFCQSVTQSILWGWRIGNLVLSAQLRRADWSTHDSQQEPIKRMSSDVLANFCPSNFQLDPQLQQSKSIRGRALAPSAVQATAGDYNQLNVEVWEWPGECHK